MKGKTINLLSMMIYVSILLALCSCGNIDNLEIELEDSLSDSLIVEYGTIENFFSGDRPKRDTIISSNALFTFSLPSDEVYIVYLYPISCIYKKTGGRTFFARQNYLVTLLEPDKKIRVDAQIRDFYVAYNARGSEFNEDYSALRAKYIVESANGARMELRIDSLSHNNGSKEEVNRLFRQRNVYNNMSQEYEIDYIQENPQSELSAFFLSKLPNDHFVNLYETLHISVKDGLFKKGLDLKKERVEKENIRIRAKNEVVKNAKAPEFSLMTSEGSVFSLSKNNSKYIVLDFWGTWCPPCISGIPKMKAYRKKYSDRIDFIGIACNEDEEVWKKKIDEFELEWMQLINDEQLDNDVAVRYGVSNYPTKFILDSEMKVIGKYTGENDDFYRMLDELLK